ncbi:DHHC family palmitoyltransferase [Sporobolomyces koalae]|uniref:DHHC family palmitoyltransferase n=1 Tax=Sporobolomyces koalae TaxID=500713 RepID=UPI003179AA13
MEIKRVQQIETNAPDPWISRKLAVGIVVAVFGYSYYVFVVRLCIPMIRMERTRLGARAQGLVYLVIFHFLFVLFCWSYIVAITTPPGFARDYVPQSDPPPEDAEYITVAGQRFEDQPLSPRMQQQQQQQQRDFDEKADDHLETKPSHPGEPVLMRTLDEDDIAEKHSAVGALGPSIASAIDPGPVPPGSPASDSAAPGAETPERAQINPPHEPIDGSPASRVAVPPPVHVGSRLKQARPFDLGHEPAGSPGGSTRSFLHFPEPPEDYEPPERLKVERVPPIAPVLKLQYRYDPKEGILRPYRSHRCRHCAAVVLKMDHHCPWVGTCVGARNYKYFYNFLQASTLYTLFVMIALVIAQTLPLSSFTPPERPRPKLDGQQIAVIAIAFFFAMFTSSLWIAHTRLILRNMTTIEEMALNRMRAKERNALQNAYGFTNWRAKRDTKRAWDRKWGRLGREGNLWWLGSKRKNWEMVMGRAKLGWIFPIRAKPDHDDGLHYVPNPRFDRDGVWRPRKDWPVELREQGLSR